MQDNTSLPDAVHLSRGQLQVSFATVEQLAEAMYVLARALDSDLDNFISAYEVRPSEDASTEHDEMVQMFEELEGRV